MDRVIAERRGGAWIGHRLGDLGGFGWADGLVLGCYLIWSANVVAVKVAVGTAGPFTFAAARWLVGALVLAAIARWREGPFQWPRGRSLGLLLAAAGSGIVVNQLAFTGALTLTSADNVSMLTGVTPLVLAGWVAVRGRERLSLRVWAGLVAGMAGLVMVVAAGGSGRATVVGDLVALAMPLSWAAYLLLLAPLLRQRRPLTLAAMVALIGAAGLVPFGAAEGIAVPPHLTWALIGVLAFSAVVAVAGVGWCFYQGMRGLGPTRTAVYGYVQPFLGLGWAALLIGEPVRTLQLVGGGVILVAIVVGRPPARRIGPLPAAADPAVPARAGPIPGRLAPAEPRLGGSSAAGSPAHGRRD